MLLHIVGPRINGKSIVEISKSIANVGGIRILCRSGTLGEPNIKRKFGVALNGGIKITVADQVDISARRLVLVLHRDVVVQLQPVHELLLQLVHVDVTRHPDGDQIVLEKHLHLHGPAARGGRHLGDRTGLAVHRRRSAVGMGERRLPPLVGGAIRGVHLGLGRLTRRAAGGLGARRVMRAAGEPRILAERARVDLKVALARCKELSDELTARNVRRHGKKLFDVLVEVLSTAVGDGIRDMGDGAGHEGQGAGPAAIAGLLLELGQKGDLEVVEIVVVSRQLPAAPILHLGLNNIPILVVIEAISRYRGGDGGNEGLLVALWRLGHVRDGIFASIAIVIALYAISACWSA